MSYDLPPRGFITFNDSRVAISEIESYNNDTSNGAYCVRLRTKSGIRHTEMGISQNTVDDRIKAQAL